MDLIYTISIFILTISIIVTFHEYGHYIAARLCGVKVKEFSIGFGKKLYGKKLGKDFQILDTVFGKFKSRFYLKTVVHFEQSIKK